MESSSSSKRVRTDKENLARLEDDDDLNCPITFDRMVDPVYCSDGQTYELEAITAALDDKPTPISPVTRQPCSILCVNRTLRRTIERTYGELLPESKFSFVDDPTLDDLERAVKARNLEKVAYIQLTGLVDMNEMFNLEDNALIRACRDSWVDGIKFLLEVGVDVGAQSDTGIAAVHKTTDVGICKELLRRGANVQVKDHRRRCALHFLAGKSGGSHAEITEFLLKNGLTVDARDENSITPLQSAALAGYNIWYADVLLRNGANIEAVCNRQRTPLHYAVSNGYPGSASMDVRLNFIKFLIQRKAKLNVRDESGATPLWIAAKSGKLDIVTCLIDAGADARLANNKGVTPQKAAENGEHTEVAAFIASRSM